MFVSVAGMADQVGNNCQICIVDVTSKTTLSLHIDCNGITLIDHAYDNFDTAFK